MARISSNRLIPLIRRLFYKILHSIPWPQCNLDTVLAYFLEEESIETVRFNNSGLRSNSVAGLFTVIFRYGGDGVSTHCVECRAAHSRRLQKPGRTGACRQALIRLCP